MKRTTMQSGIYRRIAVWVIVTACAGCREPEGGVRGAEAAGGAGEQGKAAFPVDAATARIEGRVVFEGDAPEPKPVRIDGDKFCEHCAADTPFEDERIVVHKGKALGNVFVYVAKGMERWNHEVVTEPVVVTQRGCRYEPRVVGISVGQALRVTNEDDTLHNVHFVSRLNREFNVSERKGQTHERRFKRPEVGTAFLECNIHRWMRSHVAIVRHPFYEVTGEGGTFDLGKLPAGQYEVAAWHEVLGVQTRKIRVEDGETATLEFAFAMKQVSVTGE